MDEKCFCCGKFNPDWNGEDAKQLCLSCLLTKMDLNERLKIK